MSSEMQALNQVVEDFALFDDWMERYRYLIDLGRKVPAMPENLKTDANIVPGCTSTVWLSGEIRNGVFHFEADSNSDIVKGLIYLLHLAYQEQPLDHIRDFDIRAFFEKVGLEQNLVPNRRNGFYAMVEKIRAFS